jgi:hypothetical protein
VKTLRDPTLLDSRGRLSRNNRRLSDKLLLAFHQAWDQQDALVALQLLTILESMLTRRPLRFESNVRRSMDTLVAAHERLWDIEASGFRFVSERRFSRKPPTPTTSSFRRIDPRSHASVRLQTSQARVVCRRPTSALSPNTTQLQPSIRCALGTKTQLLRTPVAAARSAAEGVCSFIY